MQEQPSTRRLEPVELYSQYCNCDRWAVIVGISEYRYPAWNLKYADRDAEEFYNLLLTPNGGGFKKEHIRKLTNEEATQGSITEALRTFLQEPARDDLVVIYFACHGAPDYNRPGNLYLLTYDTDPSKIAGTALPMREIGLSLKENLDAEKVIILADTCYSAAIGGGSGRRSVDDAELVNRYVRELSLAKPGIALLTSAEANEVSLEDAKWGGGHGVFTHYLLKGIRGAADRDRNGIVTVGELFDYVQDNVKRETNHKQHPSIGTNAYDRNLPVAIAPNANFSMTLEEEAVSLKQYREKVREYLADRKLTDFEQVSLAQFREELELSNEEAEKILEEEQAPIRQAQQAYKRILTALMQRGCYPFTEEIRKRLKEFQNEKNITDEEVEQISKPILEAAEAEYQEKLRQREEDFETFPCYDLRTIDALWGKYSKGRFGFSVQKRIWLSSDVNSNLGRFVDYVGWGQLTENGSSFFYRYMDGQAVDLSAPAGRLPWAVTYYGGNNETRYKYMSRLIYCLPDP